MVGTYRQAQVTEHTCFKDWLSRTEVQYVTPREQTSGVKETNKQKKLNRGRLFLIIFVDANDRKHGKGHS